MSRILPLYVSRAAKPQTLFSYNSVRTWPCARTATAHLHL